MFDFLFPWLPLIIGISTSLILKNVFLHGDLKEEVYMKQPLGFVAQGEIGRVYPLQKSLYGLKQSPHAWFGKFS